MAEVTLVSTGLTQGGIGTMVERIKQEVHRASSQDEAAIKIAIISAMRWFTPYHFTFNEETFTFDLTQGQEEYGVETASTDGWPKDLVAPVALYILTGGTRWLRMQQVDIEQQRYLQPTNTVQGTPTHWAWFDDKIFLTPVPSETDNQIRVDYIQKLELPRYYWDGTQWQFVLDESNAPMNDTFSNAWITAAEELIRQRAKFSLYFDYYDDQENAAKMDLAVQAALGNLRQSSNQYKRLTGRMPTRI